MASYRALPQQQRFAPNDHDDDMNEDDDGCGDTCALCCRALHRGARSLAARWHTYSVTYPLDSNTMQALQRAADEFYKADTTAAAHPPPSKPEENRVASGLT